MDEDLVARTLQIPTSVWRALVSEYRSTVPSVERGETLDGEIARCLTTMARVYRRHVPNVSDPVSGSDARPVSCPACRGDVIPARVIRTSGPSAVELRYGCCTSCGHGLLLNDLSSGAGDALAEEATVRARHTLAGYYRARDGGRAGYDGYADEARYREAKGRGIIERLRAATPTAIRTLLEVGSGFGYTRIAAERAGIATAGVDVNPDAAAETLRRYGLTTFTGTLDEALRAPGSGIAAGAYDVVLYQFVLEHVVDPTRELSAAARALRPGGWLGLLVPNMDAAEVDVFGGSYRSFRLDHRHLFTPASLAVVLASAGFRMVVCESHCNIHLFRGLLSDAALNRLYASGRGPDLFAVGEKQT